MLQGPGELGKAPVKETERGIASLSYRGISITNHPLALSAFVLILVLLFSSSAFTLDPLLSGTFALGLQIQPGSCDVPRQEGRGRGVVIIEPC
jgi:hypothetical protein